MLTNAILGFIGLTASYVAIRIFGASKLPRNQKLLIYGIGSVTLFEYLIFVIGDYGLEVGPPINLGVLELSSGYSHGLLLLLGLVIPLVLTGIACVRLKNIQATKRIAVLLVLVLSVIGVNLMQSVSLLRESQNFDDVQMCPDALYSPKPGTVAEAPCYHL